MTATAMMDASARVVAALVGMAIVGGTIRSAIRTLVLPRSAPSVLVRVVFVSWRAVYNLRASERRPYAERDRVLASFAPVSLLSLPLVWLALAIVGFTPILWASGVEPVRTAFVTSGSSILTLGFAKPDGAAATVVVFVEAGLGLGLVGLLISYLPTIYAAFSRRETEVALLEGLAGSPPDPIELLVRHQLIGGLDRLPELWERWQRWFADVQESHTSVPALCFFRSPRPEHSWVTASTCVLDAAALRLAVVDVEGGQAAAALCIRAGFVTLRHVADFFGLPYPADPAPGDPISITRAEFDEAVRALGERGVPVTRHADRAWVAYSGWRVNYDALVRGFAALVVASPPGWPAGEGSRYRPPSLRAATRITRKSRPAPPEPPDAPPATARPLRRPDARSRRSRPR